MGTPSEELNEEVEKTVGAAIGVGWIAFLTLVVTAFLVFELHTRSTQNLTSQIDEKKEQIDQLVEERETLTIEIERLRASNKSLQEVLSQRSASETSR